MIREESLKTLLLKIYSEAMTPGGDTETAIAVSRAYHFFNALTSFRALGALSPTVQKNIFEDFSEIFKKVNREIFEPNREKLSNFQFYLLFAAAEFRRQFDPEKPK